MNGWFNDRTVVKVQREVVSEASPFGRDFVDADGMLDALATARDGVAAAVDVDSP